jgi:hypothetical protein
LWQKSTRLQKSGQDFAPSQVKNNVIIRQFYIDKSFEILGNTFAPKIECADNYGGEFEHCRACVLGVIAPAPVRHDLSNSRRTG